MKDNEQNGGGVEVEKPTPTTAAAPGKKGAKKKKVLSLPAGKVSKPAIEEGADILFKAARLHGFHGTVLEIQGDNVLCRVNEEAAEGELVLFPADQLELVKHSDQLKQSNHDRLAK